MKKEKIELKRFTTLIQPKLLTQIKLISYFTNKKLNESINQSISNYINDFEKSSNTSIQSLIDLQSKFTNELDIKDKDKQSNTT